MKYKTHKNYYESGELKSEGDFIEVKMCYGRGSRKSIVIDNHECVECDPPEFGSHIVKRKIGRWKFYYKNGQLKMEGNYKVYDFIEIPSMRDGIWKTYDKNGNPMSDLNYTKDNDGWYDRKQRGQEYHKPWVIKYSNL